MMTLVWAGTVINSVLGLVHAVYVFRVVANESTAGESRAGYHAVWTFSFWLLLGSYVLVLWVIGIMLYFSFKAFR